MISEDRLRAVLREELAEQVTPRLVGVAAAARALGISESACWQLVGTGRLQSVKVGRRRLVPVHALDGFVDQQLQQGDRRA